MTDVANLAELLGGVTAEAITAWWKTYGDLASMAALLAVLPFLLLSFGVAKARRRTLAWTTAAVTVLQVLLSAEGMLEVTLIKLRLPIGLALVVFMLAELGMMRQVGEAREALRQAAEARTAAALAPTEDDAKGWRKTADRLIEEAATHRRLMWIIALATGLISATAADSPTEVFVRLLAPLMAASAWHQGIRQPVDADRPRESFKYTPRWFLVKIGAIEPADRDVREVNREHAVRAMVRLVILLEQRPTSKLSAWRERRLVRLGEIADAGMLIEARERVANALGIRTSLAPGAVATSGQQEPDAASADVPAQTAQLTISAPTIAEISTNDGGKVSTPATTNVFGHDGKTLSVVPPSRLQIADHNQAPTPSAETPPKPIPGNGGAGRAEDVARQLRAAIDAGQLEPDPKVTHVMSQLGTSYRNAKAALELLNGS